MTSGLPGRSMRRIKHLQIPHPVGSRERVSNELKLADALTTHTRG